MEDHPNDSHTQHGESIFSAALAEATGYVVLEAAQAEDTIGELIMLRGAPGQAPTEWWRSGNQLLEFLRGIGDPQLEPVVEEYERLLALRNDVVHGLTLGDDGLMMKRARTTKENRSKGAEYEVSVRNVAGRHDLASDFRRLERMAFDAISDFMRLERTAESGLRQRSTRIADSGRHSRPVE